MSSRSSASRFLHRRFAWLLWLVLLLPVGQTLAMRHVLLDHANERDTHTALVHEHCALCLNAAALLGGAPPVSSSALVLVTIKHALPISAVVAHYIQTPAQAYDSRGPPLFRL